MTSRRPRFTREQLGARRLIPARSGHPALRDRVDPRRPRSARTPRTALELAVGRGVEPEQLAGIDLLHLAAPLVEQIGAQAATHLLGHGSRMQCPDKFVKPSKVDGLSRGGG